MYDTSSFSLAGGEVASALIFGTGDAHWCEL